VWDVLEQTEDDKTDWPASDYHGATTESTHVNETSSHGVSSPQLGTADVRADNSDEAQSALASVNESPVALHQVLQGLHSLP
jgi:hypothetical protein